MPVEIKELVIKAIVDEGGGPAGSATGGSGQEESTEMIIQACVERVMEILKDKNER